MSGRMGRQETAVRRIRWKSDFEKKCLVTNFERRGWRKCLEDEDEYWNIYWASKSTHLSSVMMRLGEDQVVNHFPNHYELTRKDLMVKNIKKYKKELDRNGRSEFDEIVPVTFTLPTDYPLFAEEFRRVEAEQGGRSLWIMKPCAKCQGVGIFLISKISQIKKWASRNGDATGSNQYVVSRYIEHPLLVGGRKFDLRIYVLVAGYNPLRAYVHRQGFARFCTAKYSSNIADVDNVLMHLTNVSVQKQADEYNEEHGGKWHIKNLRLYLQAACGLEMTEKLFQQIRSLIYHSLKACQSVIINDKHCFELYGYDVLIDANLKPWLVEVNASPSLAGTTGSDLAMKTGVINDVLNIVFPDDFPEVNKNNNRSDACWKSGDFVQLVDEVTGFNGSVGRLDWP
mmetsp:Transcript_30603/g.77050  ORF Transcript_30603/g.77050 Transcript_30603/m.77050 type:complete len:398 (+) Transcript_30603:26-1219(+)